MSLSAVDLAGWAAPWAGACPHPRGCQSIPAAPGAPSPDQDGREGIGPCWWHSPPGGDPCTRRAGRRRHPRGERGLGTARRRRGPGAPSSIAGSAGSWAGGKGEETGWLPGAGPEVGGGSRDSRGPRGGGGLRLAGQGGGGWGARGERRGTGQLGIPGMRCPFWVLYNTLWGFCFLPRISLPSRMRLFQGP